MLVCRPDRLCVIPLSAFSVRRSRGWATVLWWCYGGNGLGSDGSRDRILLNWSGPGPAVPPSGVLHLHPVGRMPHPRDTVPLPTRDRGQEGFNFGTLPCSGDLRSERTRSRTCVSTIDETSLIEVSLLSHLLVMKHCSSGVCFGRYDRSAYKWKRSRSALESFSKNASSKVSSAG